MKIEQPMLFDMPLAETAPSAKKVSCTIPAKPTLGKNCCVVGSLSEALAINKSGLVIIDDLGEWPEFDANDPKYFTPDAEGYIEAERLPPEWLALVGKTVCADRTTVGTIADLLEELPRGVAERWREMYANADTDEGCDALSDFEDAHRIRWYGEGYYIETE